jgi:surface antigen
LFGVAALPAYAFQETEESVASYAVADSQSIRVATDAAPNISQRDAFTATTPEQLAQLREAEAAAALASLRASTRQSGDDYPYLGQYSLTPLGFYGSECVDFVAWRLNRDQGFTSAPFRWTGGSLGVGSAGSWISGWQNNGRTVSMTPIPGAVAVTNSNHVAYVAAVFGDGTVLLEEYNRNWDNTYSTRVIQAGSVLAYLYPPG